LGNRGKQNFSLREKIGFRRTSLFDCSGETDVDTFGYKPKTSMSFFTIKKETRGGLSVRVFQPRY
jgi:hypothetical protein